jgi:predicted ester cyclase
MIVDGPMSTLDDNRALVIRLVEIVNARELDAIGEVASGQVASEAARWVGPFTASFPNFRMEVVDVIAEGEKVVGYFKCSGTHEGEWRGAPPTGRRFAAIDEVYIFQVEDGKLVAALAVVEDNLRRMRQLGLVE